MTCAVNYILFCAIRIQCYIMILFFFSLDILIDTEELLYVRFHSRCILQVGCWPKVKGFLPSYDTWGFS